MIDPCHDVGAQVFPVSSDKKNKLAADISVTRVQPRTSKGITAGISQPQHSTANQQWNYRPHSRYLNNQVIGQTVHENLLCLELKLAQPLSSQQLRRPSSVVHHFRGGLDYILSPSNLDPPPFSL